MNLLNGLQQIPNSHEYFVGAENTELVQSRLQLDDRFKVMPIESNPLKRLFYTIPKLAASNGIDIVVVTYAGPVFIRKKMVCIVHDVIYKKYPGWFSPRDRIVLNLGVGITIRRADLVVTVSENSRKDILHYYAIPDEKIAVVPEAAGQIFYKVDRETVQSVCRRFNISGPYLLCVGNLQPRKNLMRIIRAFSEVINKDRYRHLKLVVAGKAQWRESDIYHLVTSLGIKQNIIFTDYVSDSELVALYSGARLFLYPSLYEGFGLPPLEAMSCGVPVLTSNNSSIPEVVGDAAHLIDPTCVKQISDGILKILSDRAYSETLIRRGKAQAKKYSWSLTAKQFLNSMEALS